MTSRVSSSPDIRMRGFRQRHTVEAAWHWIDSHIAAQEVEAVSLSDVHGRVLAESIVSPIDVPEFDRSAMDGFAVNAAETIGAGDYNPISFRMVGNSWPGSPATVAVGAGEAIRIMTGAPLPSGADAVVPAEYANETGDRVEVTTSVARHKNVGQRGEDVVVGMTLLPTGQVLRPQDVGLLASVGLSHVAVVRRPRVRIVITGNELVVPGAERRPFQIYEANSLILQGLIPRDGGVVESVVRCRDERSQIRDALTTPGADLILISGGSSVGAEDHAPHLVHELGELPIHGLAMRPSSPAGMGKIESACVFLLPGNPVSCLCAYDFFAGRAIRRLGGRASDWPYAAREGTLVTKIASQIGRVDYCRVRIDGDEIEPLALSGASILSSTTRANGFVIVPAMSEGYSPGTRVTARLYGS